MTTGTLRNIISCKNVSVWSCWFEEQNRKNSAQNIHTASGVLYVYNIQYTTYKHKYTVKLPLNDVA